MSRSKMVTLDKDWWKKDREPIRGRSSLKIQSPPKAYPIGTKLLEFKDACRELGISRWTLTRYIKEGMIDAIPKVKGYQIPESAILEFRAQLAAQKRRAG